jgi:hypothetical protein
MTYIGWAFVLCTLAGMVGLIDFHVYIKGPEVHVCIKGPGECRIEENTWLKTKH